MRPLDDDDLAEAIAAHVEAAIEVAFGTGTNAGTNAAVDAAVDADVVQDGEAVLLDPLAPAGALAALDPTAVEHVDLAWAADGGRVVLADRAQAPATFDDDFGTVALAATRAGYWAVRAWYAARAWPAAAGSAPADGTWRSGDVRARLDVADGFLTAMAHDWYTITCDLPSALLDRLAAVTRVQVEGHEVLDVFALRAGDLRETVAELVSIGAAVAVLELAALHHAAAEDA